jgi:hypothetical protein
MVAPPNTLNKGQSTDENISQLYHDVVRPHVESFDNFVDHGMAKVAASVDPVRVRFNLLAALAQLRTSRAHLTCAIWGNLSNSRQCGRAPPGRLQPTHAWVQVRLKVRNELWELWLDNPTLGKPVLEDDRVGTRPLLPRHCREMVRHCRPLRPSAAALHV